MTRRTRRLRAWLPLVTVLGLAAAGFATVFMFALL